MENFDNLEIETVQGLMMLSLHYFGLGAKEKSWMFGSMAIQMSHALRLNEEDDTLIMYSPGAEDSYTRSRTAIRAEARRRTYWGNFLLDRYRFNCELYRNPYQVKEENAFVHLPCGEEFFEHGIPVQTELLIRADQEPRANPQLLGTTAHLIRIIRIWGNIAVLFFEPKDGAENPNRPINLKLNASTFSRFLNECNEWYDDLPGRYRFSSENLDFQYMEKNSTADTFILMNVAYHACLLLLHRYVRLTGNEDKATITAHLRECYCHAYKIISIVNECEKRKRRLIKAGEFPEMTSSPFLGPAILMATDVVARWAAHLLSEHIDKDGYATNTPEVIRLWNAHRGLRIAAELLESIGLFWDPFHQLHLVVCAQINRIRVALNQVKGEDIRDETDIGDFGSCPNFSSWKVDSSGLAKIKSTTNLIPAAGLTDIIYSGDFFTNHYGSIDTMRLQSIMNESSFSQLPTQEQSHALANYTRINSTLEIAMGKTVPISEMSYQNFDDPLLELEAAYGGAHVLAVTSAPEQGTFLSLTSPLFKMDITVSQLDELTTSQLADWAPEDMIQ